MQDGLRECSPGKGREEAGVWLHGDLIAKLWGTDSTVVWTHVKETGRLLHVHVVGWELPQVLGDGNHNLVGEEAPEKRPAGSGYQPVLTKAEKREHLAGEGDLGRKTTLPAVAQHLQNRPVSLSPGFHLSLIEVLLWARPCAEHPIFISLHFLIRHSQGMASELLFTEEAQRGLAMNPRSHSCWMVELAV